MNAEAKIKVTRDIDRIVGANFRKLRVAAKMTRKTIAEIVAVSVQQVHKYESGVNRISSGTLYVLAAHLDKPIEHFFEQELDINIE